MTKWISVKERLPEDTKMYLCYVAHENKNYIKYIITLLFDKDGPLGKNLWSDVYFSKFFDQKGWDVTHWMPLPEPPK